MESLLKWEKQAYQEKRDARHSAVNGSPKNRIERGTRSTQLSATEAGYASDSGIREIATA
jgi:hypothetical protein